MMAFPNQTELMKLNPQALHYGAMIPEGGSWKDLPYEILPERWKKIRDNMADIITRSFFAVLPEMKSVKQLPPRLSEKRSSMAPG